MSMTQRDRRTALALTLALVCAAALSACRQGPDTTALRKQVQSKLDLSFKRGLFEVRNLSRRGHYPYNEEGEAAARLLIYYNAEIALLKDYKLSNWDQLNVGSLISVLGATSNGVRGVKPRGNRRGDILEVHGSTAFAEEDGAWHAVAFLPGAGEGKKKRGPRDKDLLPYRQHLKELGRVGAAFQAAKDKGDLTDLTNRLEVLRADAERRLGRSKGWLTIASGNPGGEYYRQGEGLQRILKQAGLEARSYRTSGSAENCRLVERREVLFGYSQNDIAHMGLKGTELFEGQIPLSHLRALCSLYPEALQIVARKSSKIRAVADLRGKRVNIGPSGSGVRLNALQVLRAVKISLRDLKEVGRKEIPAALDDLRRGHIDALFLTSAYPNPALYALADKTPIDLIPLDQATVEKLIARDPFFTRLSLPAKTYPGMEQPRVTVQVTAMLVTHRDTPAARVKSLLTNLYTHVDELTQGSLQAYFISKKRALQGVSIPLHPAARAFFGK
jgi:TRAP transporter TAXI family solute receptor